MKFGRTYKGTQTRVQRKDNVLISRRLAQENKVNRAAIVVGLQGFITVRLSNGEQMDLDARQVTFVSRGEA